MDDFPRPDRNCDSNSDLLRMPECQRLYSLTNTLTGLLYPAFWGIAIAGGEVQFVAKPLRQKVGKARAGPRQGAGATAIFLPS
jgi:hypothetical protein